MKRPSFQFYPADWLQNAKLRRCTLQARGAWMDVLCLMHDSDEYGILRWPLKEIARASAVPTRVLRELADRTVLKGDDVQFDGFTFTPRHAGVDGEPVILIPKGAGPLWFSSRFVVDEYVRGKRGAASRYSSENQPHARTDAAPLPSPKGGFGGGFGDGPSSSSSSTSSKDQELPPTAGRSEPPDSIFGVGLSMLTRNGVEERPARSFLGMLRKKLGDIQTVELLARCESEGISDPLAWLSKCANTRMSSEFANSAHMQLGTPRRRRELGVGTPRQLRKFEA